MTDLLEHRVKTLRLREDAPFPSECEDAQQLIREWRHEQRVRLVRSFGSPCDRGADDCERLA